MNTWNQDELTQRLKKLHTIRLRFCRLVDLKLILQNPFNLSLSFFLSLKTQREKENQNKN